MPGQLFNAIADAVSCVKERAQEEADCGEFVFGFHEFAFGPLVHFQVAHQSRTLSTNISADLRIAG